MTILRAPHDPGRHGSREIVGDRQPYVGAVGRWYGLCLEKTQIIIYNSSIGIRNGRLTVMFPTQAEVES
jgi:hypothetical protein